jgi:uncharacterized membrane protein
MNLKKLGLDNGNDGAMTVLAGVTLLNVVLRFWRSPVWFTAWDYLALGFIAVAVLFSWFANFKHRQQIELVREPADEKSINLLSVWSRSSVFWACMMALQAMTFVHPH